MMFKGVDHVFSMQDISENTKKLTCTCEAVLIATHGLHGKSYHFEFSGNGDSPPCPILFGQMSVLWAESHAMQGALS